MSMKRWLPCLVLATAAHAADFERDIRPLIHDHCHACHSTEKQKGDLDLERFTSVAEVRRHPEIWEHVLEQLANNEMPPKKEPPLSPDQKKLLTTWAGTMLDEVALASAGDPGPVVLRRLSNMEYTYTIRDLTGVESLDPAREFPVDGAAGEGFTNAGAALVMSPALLTKYLDAAKEVASHAVLLPDGIRFSPSSSQQDWTGETLAKIRAIYARHTVTGEGSQTVQQGIKLDTGTGGGRLPLARYLDALQGRGSAEGLSTKYLGILREALSGTQRSVLLDPLRVKFKDRQLTAADIEPWQQVLWRFASVGHIGKENGPKAWQEPVTPLVPQHEMRVKLNSDRDLALYLTTGDAGNGDSGDEVVWENPRLVAAGRPDLPIAGLPDLVQDFPLTGPLLAPAMRSFRSAKTGPVLKATAPSVIKIQIPAVLAKGTEFVVTGRLVSKTEGSVQMQVLTEKPGALQGLVAGRSDSSLAKGEWSDNNLVTQHRAPIIVNENSAARKRFEEAFDGFRTLFPIALCYTKIVPVDEVVTLTLFHREDECLRRLILDEAQAQELDRLWDELIFVSEAPLKQVDGFEQLFQFATQDAKPSAFEPMRLPILKAAEAFKVAQKAADAKQRQAVIEFAAKAWRRPLTEKEIAALRQFPPRLMLARVLTSPAFLYRGEKSPEKTGPVNGQEMATRLSYFLWSSAPDEALRADADKLHDPEILAAHAKRMLKSDKVRRLATEFGCQWLHVRDVATLDEKSDRHFPTFVSLREDMQEEVTRFFIDLIQNDRSVLSLLDADHSFVNGPLAKHYGMDVEGDQWRRIDGLRAKGRGGILGFAATLSKQSGASRTSPILRGNWLSEVVLGERLPRPPKGVPVLPDEAPEGLTERQLIERHSGDEKCAGCHRRIDPFGFALEGFDAIGRTRERDTATTLADGTAIHGATELREYLVTTRRDDFLRQFSRKLLGYALGRSVQLSDKPLIEAMLVRLHEDGHRVGTAIDLIVLSPQFREVRGRERKVD